MYSLLGRNSIRCRWSNICQTFGQQNGDNHRDCVLWQYFALARSRIVELCYNDNVTFTLLRFARLPTYSEYFVRKDRYEENKEKRSESHSSLLLLLLMLSLQLTRDDYRYVLPPSS